MHKLFLLTTLLILSFSCVAIDSLIITKSVVLSATSDIKPKFSLHHITQQPENQLGFDVSLLSERDMSFAVMTCENLNKHVVNSSSTEVCTNGNAPWIENSIHNKTTNHHGIGIFINSKKNLLTKFIDYEFIAESDITYEYGLGYNYNSPYDGNSSLQFAAHLYRYNDKRINNSNDSSGISVQLGYQF